MRGERIAAPIFALLIVFSGAGGAIAPGASPVGTVEAQAGDGSGGACEATDWFLTLVTGTLLTTDCKTAEDVSDSWNETDAKETRTQIHSQAGQLKAGNEQFLIAMNNAMKDSNTVAFSKGEAAAVEVLANGGTVSEAQQAANESIANYYAQKQLNELDRWEVYLETIETLDMRADNTTGVANNFVTIENKDGQTYNEYTGEKVTKLRTSSKQLTLTNGSQAQTLQIGVHFGNNITMTGNPPWGGSDFTKFRIQSTTNLTSKTISFANFRNEWDDIDASKTATQEEVSVYVNQSLAPAVDSGTLNATSYVSPATLAQEYAQEYGNDTSYIRATAIAAYSGMDAPNLNETGSMTISYNGTTYEGLLLSQQAPSGGWQTGETYDPALLSGLQMFATAGDNSSIIQLDQSFTVESIKNTNGEQISKATTYNITYKTANTSEDYAQLQEQIRTLNKQIEERKAQATTGGSDVQSGTNPFDALASFLGISVGAAVVVLIAAAALVAKFYIPD